MTFLSSSLHLAMFALVLGTVAVVLVPSCALYYLRRVRLERPAIGAFNGRDIAVLFVLLCTIPLFYVQLPRWLLTSFLALTFIASLSIGYKPVLRPAVLWLSIGTLLGLNIWLGNNGLGTVRGWQTYWAENDIIIVLGAVAVANLYVQGGMKLQHVAWFALALAVYDEIFSTLYPLTNALIQDFLGFPLDPSFGMRWSFDNAAIGIGDLLVYALFVLAAFKAYGRQAARITMAVVVVFGAVVPALVPLIINYIDPRTDTLVPAQAWFGPVAFLVYRLLRRRYGRERTTREFLASADVITRGDAVPTSPAGAPEPDAATAPAQESTDVRPVAAEPIDAKT